MFTDDDGSFDHASFSNYSFQYQNNESFTGLSSVWNNLDESDDSNDLELGGLGALRFSTLHSHSFLENIGDKKQSNITLEFLQHLDDVTEQCTQKIRREREKFSPLKSKKHCQKALEKYFFNLNSQQKEFESFIANIKSQYVYSPSTSLEPYSKDLAMKLIKNELKMFEHFFPAYGHRNEVLNMIQQSKVIVIPSESHYYFNVVLPLLINNSMSDHSVVCCESSSISRSLLISKINSILECQTQTNFSSSAYSINRISILSVDRLLKCISNVHSFQDGNTIFIINLQLKRFLNVDLLMANVHELLQKRENMKLILLISMYDDDRKFCSYFSEFSPSTFRVPTLTFPVKVVWKSAPLAVENDYVGEVIRTIVSILVLNELGDILVFVPTLSEAKKTTTALCERLELYNLQNVEYVLFDKINLEADNMEMLLQKQSIRKIYFATSSFEVILVPTIRYVVDVGLNFDLCFDSDKNVDSCILNFNSHSTAMLRTSFAGTYYPGVCYRLYNQENYFNEMTHAEQPEILCLNPCNSLLKILRQCPGKSLKFVDGFPPTTEEKVTDALEKSQAIKDRTLTTLGENIASLPFSFRHSQLLLLGLKYGLLQETIIIVAFLIIKRNPFKHTSDETAQKVIDGAKLEFLQLDSDLLSFLFAFKMWFCNDCSYSWCEKNFIVYDTMKLVQQKVSNIVSTISESMNFVLECNYSDSQISAHLIDLLFKCFYDNLCVFTGHHRSGYRMLHTNSLASIHPNSMICHGNYPQFIIYDHAIKGPKQGLSFVTALTTDIVLQNLETGLLSYSYQDLFEKSLIQRVIEHVGGKVINELIIGVNGQELKKIEKNLKKEANCELIFIEPSQEKGCIFMYAPNDIVDFVLCSIQDILDENLKQVSDEEVVKVIELKNRQNKMPIEALWGRGAEIKSISLAISGSTAIPKSISATVEARDVELVSDSTNCIKLKWLRRPCTGIGFIDIAGDGFTEVRKLSMKVTHILGTDVFIQRSSLGENQLKVSDIPVDTTEKEFEKAVAEILPNVQYRVSLKHSLAFETSEQDLQKVYGIILENCVNYSNLVNFEICVHQPLPTDIFMKATIDVFEDRNLDLEVYNLSRTFVNGMKLSCSVLYRSKIECSINMCVALKSSFQKALEKLNCVLNEKYGPECVFKFTIDTIDKDDLAEIKFSSQYDEVVQMLHRTITKLLEGDIINAFGNREDFDKLFCHGGLLWLKALEKSQNVFIIINSQTKVIRLYGSEENCYNARLRIGQFLDDSNNEVMKTIQLSNDASNKMFLKAFIKQYGVNPTTLVEDCNLQSAVLDIKSNSLLLQGTTESISKAENCLNELSSTVQIGNEILALSAECCPVCMCPADGESYCLEVCGHVYCIECVNGLTQANQFPIQCCAEGCSKDLVLADIRKILKNNENEINNLLERALKAYQEKNHATLYFCPAPDCNMFVLKKSNSEATWKCPLCKNDICMNCNVVYHKGYTCDMYQGSKKDPDYSFKVWQAMTTKCKKCPTCNSAIEKIEGCNHMTCSNCRGHFCWICLAAFSTGDEVYRHIHSTHPNRLYDNN
ncbi:uncharacterized protein LOC129220114 [Uloborus diversus]|uniref:uncharacterized protein LOC129220114 n=1 Tax=Uloborus diversus TaxID=327109 RepID=UPI002409A1C2|nr:uncharacterized protein LOC129220114 [Uloborus diversus]